MITREYQVDHIDRIIEEVSTKRKVLAQLPTGGGKTVEFAFIAKRYTENTDKAVIILVHRKELLQQAAKTVKSILGLDSVLITSTSKRYKFSRVYIGMVDSTVSRLNLIGTEIGLVIIDECHIATFNKIHSIFLEELIIGFSATPKSTSKKEPMNKYYSSIIVGPQIKQLISMGYLAQNITRCPKDVVDATKFSLDKFGDYNEREMAAEYKLPKHVINVVKNYHRFCLGKKTIIFNVNIEHSKEVSECFQHCGYNCKHLASDNESERDEILKWFKETKDAILCNVMIATVGFDEPTVLNVITNFSTLSLVKAIQCWGRGGRIIDEAFIQKFQHEYPYQLETKDYFTIIDMGGNCIRFGDWNDDRDWDYIFSNPERPGDGIAPYKTCPSCEGLVHAAATICTLMDEKGDLCGHKFPRRLSGPESDLEEMVLITKGIDVEGLIGKNRKKHEYYTFLEMGVDIVKDMFRTHKNPSITIIDRYFVAYYTLCIKWYNKTLAGKEGYMDNIDNSGWHITRAKNNFDNLMKKYKNTTSEIKWNKDKVYDWMLTDNEIESTQGLVGF